MTKVITRYFDSAAQAHSVQRELVYQQRFPQTIVHVFDDPDGLAGKLTSAHVEDATAKAYQDRMAKGGW